MRKLLFVAMLIILTSCGEKTIEANYNIIPLPQQIQSSEGPNFILDKNTSIEYDSTNERVAKIADFLNQYLEQNTGYKLALNTEVANRIVLQINSEIQNSEGYKISINENTIEIAGGSEAGLFYGVQTIRKSIPVASDKTNKIIFKSVEIEDQPRFAYRGMMLDVSRHFSSVDYVKRHIDLLALHNINKFHMHLTEDQGWRIEIKKYPKLTEIGSQRKETIKGFITGEFDSTPYGPYYYTQEELKDIVKYAEERYIEIIPEIDLPGHMSAALASYPELGCTGGPYEVITRWGIFPDVLCAGNEQVYQFLEDVLTEVFEIFPSKYIHIGGDECPKIRWEKCPKCQGKIKQLGLKDDKESSKESKLQSYLTHRLEKFITSKGREFIGWDEIIEGGLAPNATVMSWRGETGGRFAAQTGHNVIMCPNSHFYLDYYQTENTFTEPEAFPEVNSMEEIYHYNPIPSGLSEEEAKRVLGIQANLWREQIKEDSHVEYMTLPRLAAVAELQWTDGNKKDYRNFLDRIQNMISIYDQLGYNFAVTAFEPKGEFIEDKENKTVSLKLSTYDDAKIYYTIDGTAPNTSSPQYSEPIKLEGKGELRAKVFRNNKLIDKNLYIEYFNINKATLKNIELLTPASKYFNPPKGAALLVDGVRGNGCHVFGNPTSWIGFGGKMEVVVDLGEIQDIQAVTTSVLLVPNSKGAKYSISTSEDGEGYNNSHSEHLSFNATDDLTASLKGAKARYIKIEVIADNYAHVLSDEIIIE